MSELLQSSDTSSKSAGDGDRKVQPPYQFQACLKAQAAKDLKRCRLSRVQVADQLTHLLNQRITVAQIDAMVAASKPHRLPAEWIPAWVQVTGSPALLRLLCEQSGYWLADQLDHDLAALARTEIERDRAARRIAQIRESVEAQL